MKLPWDGKTVVPYERPIRKNPVTSAMVRVRKVPPVVLAERYAIETERDAELAYAAKRAVVESESRRAYTAYGAARNLWSCREEEILIEGPAGTGKTRALLEKLHFCAMKYPGFRGLIIRKTRESLTTSVLVTFEEKVVPAGSSILTGPKRRLRATYYYPNGSEIDVGGMDKASKVMSTEYDMICCFESTELTEEDFENLTTRLRNWKMPYQQIVADCNPGIPRHWLNQRPKTKGMTRLLSRHEDNPTLFDHKAGRWTLQGAAYIKKLDRLSGARRLRLLLGKWAAAEGMVYPDFGTVHIKSFEDFRWPRDDRGRRLPPNSWRRVVSIDFGFTNPFVAQWWAIDEDGRMYLYREIYFSKRIVADHAEVIKAFSAGEEIEAYVADWDAEDRATLERAGITTIPAFKDIQPGIQACEQRMRTEEDGRPRIYFMRDAVIEVDQKLVEKGLPVQTIDEPDNYIYDPKADEKKAPKENPVDKDNHGMDAMRYAVAYVDNLASMILETQAEPAAVVYAGGMRQAA